MNTQDILILLPELLLVCGAMLLLLYGCYCQKTCWYTLTGSALSLVTMAVLYLLVSFGAREVLFEGMLVYSPYTTYVKLLILIGGGALIAVLPSLANQDPVIKAELLVLMLLSMVGMMLLVSSNNLLSLYMAMELMSLPLYIMAAMDRNNLLSSEAGLKYFVLGALASGFYLFGASLIYGFTGSLSFAGINDYFLTVATTLNADNMIVPTAFLVGLIFIMVSLAFKISAVPFHMWAPDVYQGAPMIVTAFFAVVPKVASIALLVRLMYGAFVDHAEHWLQVVTFLSMASLIVGALGAIVQHNIKRLLAYSSIGHVGFALVGLASSDGDGLRGLLIYMAIYMVMSLGIFSCLLMLKKDGVYKEEIRQFSGLARSHPYLAAAIAVTMFSMAGIPPLAGFFAKFYVLYAAVKQEFYLLAVVAVLASVISSYYYLYIIKVMYFDEPRERADTDYPWALRVVATICVALNILYVLAPSYLLIAAEAAVASLFTV